MRSPRSGGTFRRATLPRSTLRGDPAPVPPRSLSRWREEQQEAKNKATKAERRQRRGGILPRYGRTAVCDTTHRRTEQDEKLRFVVARLLSRSTVMSRSDSSRVKNARRAAEASSPRAPLPGTPTPGKAPTHRGNIIPVAKRLSILAVCLGAVLVVSLVLEAFDDDLDLWPFGSQDFTLAPQGPPITACQAVGSSAGSTAAVRCLVTAGAHLVLGHRARSALPTDRSPRSSMMNMAEPWAQNLKAAPVLGHLFPVLVSPEELSYS
jgi:hypothetical protein